MGKLFVFSEHVFPFLDLFSGNKQIDQKSSCHTNSGVQHTVQRVGDKSIHRCIEQDDTKYHAARLNTARPLEKQTGQNQKDDSYEEEDKQTVVTLNKEGG